MNNETVPIVLKRRAECPMCNNNWDTVEKLSAERDQFAAALDIFKGKVQALEMERDEWREENATLRRKLDIRKDWDAQAEEGMERLRTILGSDAWLPHSTVGDKFTLLEHVTRRAMEHWGAATQRDEARADAERLRRAAAFGLKALLSRPASGDWGTYGQMRDEARISLNEAISGSPSAAEWLAQHDAKLKKQWDEEFRAAWDAEHGETDDDKAALADEADDLAALRERVKVLEEAWRSLEADAKEWPHGEDCEPEDGDAGCECVKAPLLERARAALSTPTADKGGFPALLGQMPDFGEGDGAPKPKCATCGGLCVVPDGIASDLSSTWSPCPACKEKP